MSAETARTLAQIMKGVAKDGGTGPLAAIPGIEVAGKTGTAEKVDPVTKRYSSDDHLSSFVGFAPADDPRVVAIVIVDEPQGEHFGGIVAAPAWRRMVERALLEDGLLAAANGGAAFTAARTTPREGVVVTAVGERERAVVQGTVPDLRGLAARAAVRTAEAAGLDVVIKGSGVVKQEPAPNTSTTGGAVKLTLADASTIFAEAKR